MFEERVARALPEDARGDRDAIRTLANPNDSGPRRVPARHRAAGDARKAGRRARAVSTELHEHARISRLRDRTAAHASRAIPIAVELRHSSWSDRLGETLALLNEFRRRGCRSTSRSSASLFVRIICPTCAASTTCASTGGTPRRGGSTTSRRIATTTSTPPTSCSEFSETADAAKQLVKKLYLYTNNHFSAKSVANAAMIKDAARGAARRRVSARLSRALPGVARGCKRTDVMADGRWLRANRRVDPNVCHQPFAIQPCRERRCVHSVLE